MCVKFSFLTFLALNIGIFNNAISNNLEFFSKKNIFFQRVGIDTTIFPSQDANETKFMHLLMAYKRLPEHLDYSEDTELIHKKHPIILWRNDEDSLSCVDTLNFNFREATVLHNLLHFKNQKWFFISEEILWSRENYIKYDDNWPRYHSILDYSNDSLVIRRVNQAYIHDFRSELPYKWLIKKGEEELLFYDMYIAKKSRNFFAINKSFERQEVSPNDFLFPINDGRTGFQDGTLPHYYFSKNTGILRMPFDLGSGTAEGNPKTLIQVPDDFKLQRADLQFLIIDQESRYVIAKPRFYDKPKDSIQNTVLVHDRDLDTWQYVKLPGERSVLSISGEWLYGMEKNFWKYEPNDKISKDSVSNAQCKI